MSTWSAATLARWCGEQGDSLRTPHFQVATLLAGVDGAALLAMSDYALDELGVPARMRGYLRAKLQPASAEPVAVEAQVEAAERHGREFVKSISNHDASERRESVPGGYSASAPASREASETAIAVVQPPAPPSMLTAQVAAGLAGAFAATTALIASEREKRERGDATLSDTMSASVALPYAWAAESAQFGLEWVKKALQVGEGVPMVGAIFTLCLLVAQVRDHVTDMPPACAC